MINTQLSYYEKLGAEGKIKKDKFDSVIFRGDDNSHYEKLNGKTVCIDEEIPFDIPETWAWVRFGSVVSYNLGRTPPRSESQYWLDGKYSWISISDMPTDGIIVSTKEKISEIAFKELFKERICVKDTLLMSFKLTIGRVAILGIDAFHNEAIISIFPYLNENNFFQEFLFVFLPLLTQGGDSKNSIKGETLNSTSLANLLIPLPPKAEQARILSRIKEITPFVKQYEKYEVAESELDEKLPDLLRKSILQYAIEGKLVPQDPTDEPAEKLLERIRAEKERLIKAGKIKRNKTESVIYKTDDNSYYEKLGAELKNIDDEITFEIPNSWCWVRLCSIIELISGQDMTPDCYSEKENGIPYLTGASNIENEMVIINRWTTMPRAIAVYGDLLITCKGTVGAMAFLKCEQAHIARQFMAIRVRGQINGEYIKVFMETYVSTLQNAAKSIIPGIAREDILNAFIPVPPLAEQKRIVQQIDLMFEQIQLIKG